MGGYKEYRIYHEINGKFSVYVGELHPLGGFLMKEVIFTSPLVSECYAYLQAIDNGILIRE
jgi:hypothetical protein